VRVGGASPWKAAPPGIRMRHPGSQARMCDDTSTTDLAGCNTLSWITSRVALAERIGKLGRKHELTEALIRRAAPVLEPSFQSQPCLWRFNFLQPTWNKRRCGDGRLSGLYGSWGPLSQYIRWLTWTAELAWARKILDAELIGSLLGLRVPSRGLNLERLPAKARLELWPSVVEPRLLQWAAEQEPQHSVIKVGGMIELQHSGLGGLSQQAPDPPRKISETDIRRYIEETMAAATDGKTSANQLRDNARKWYADNHFVFGGREDWHAWLNRPEYVERRRTGGHSIDP
jgi:hypothetical protein